MKKFIIIILAVVSFGFVSCKSDNSHEPYATNVKHNLPGCQYHSEEDYALFYDQIYEVIAHINSDSSLDGLQNSNVFNDSLIIDNIINSGILSYISESYTYQELNNVVVDFFGQSLDNITGDVDASLLVFPAICSGDTVISKAQIYNFLTQAELDEGNTVILYCVCAAYNLIIERTKLYFVLLDDSSEKRLEVFTGLDFSDFPGNYNTTIFHVIVDDINEWNRDEIPFYVCSGTATVDTLAFQGYNDLINCLWSEYGLDPQSIAIEECYTEYRQKCERIMEEYRNTVININNSGMSHADQMIFRVAAEWRRDAKIESAKYELDCCLRSATNENQG